MATITGKVTSKSRSGTGIQIDRGAWYNGSKGVLSGVEYKSTVTLEVDDDRNIVSAIPSGSDAGSVAQASGKSYNNDTQRSIEWQAARKAAVAFVVGILPLDIIDVPKAKDVKFDAILNLVEMTTESFYRNSYRDLEED